MIPLLEQLNTLFVNYDHQEDSDEILNCLEALRKMAVSICELQLHPSEIRKMTSGRLT